MYVHILLLSEFSYFGIAVSYFGYRVVSSKKRGEKLYAELEYTYAV